MVSHWCVGCCSELGSVLRTLGALSAGGSSVFRDLGSFGSSLVLGMNQACRVSEVTKMTNVSKASQSVLSVEILAMRNQPSAMASLLQSYCPFLRVSLEPTADIGCTVGPCELVERMSPKSHHEVLDALFTGNKHIQAYAHTWYADCAGELHMLTATPAVCRYGDSSLLQVLV